MAQNHRVVLASRPGQNKTPTIENFRYEPCQYPSLSSESGFVVVQLHYLSVDPYMRSRMNETTSTEYLISWKLGQVITGSAMGQVIASNSEKFAEGDFVFHFGFDCPWKSYVCVSEGLLSHVDHRIPKDKHSLVLGVYGLNGLTSYLALQERAGIDKHKNQTIVISAAAGGCGTIACQLAKFKGCGNVVGMAGTEGKCEYLTRELGIDGAICYKTENVKEKLKELCSDGIDIYLDNVGGEISDIVIKQMKDGGAVIIVGQVAICNKDLPFPSPLPEEIEKISRGKNLAREPFYTLLYKDKFQDGLEDLFNLVESGVLKTPETVICGLENAGKAFVSMMEGGNTGKQIVRL